MPCFYFDLVIGRACREQGGMILESQDAAAEKADSLAGELAIVRPELKNHRASVRVLDENDAEIYRTPISPSSVPPAALDRVPELPHTSRFGAPGLPLLRSAPHGPAVHATVQAGRAPSLLAAF